LNYNGRLEATTKVNIDSAYEKLDFFHGQAPDSDGKGVPCQTLIFPVSPSATDDPLYMLLNPEDFTIQVFYIYFFPYDWVKYGFGNHVGDIEHTNIIFEKLVPTRLYVSEHSWETIVNWGDPSIEMDGNHPVTYNARGTHATYLSGGWQWYAEHTIFDVCGQGQMWDLQQTLEIIFPWEYLTEDKICTAEGWEGINWLTQIYQWGNEGTGLEIPIIDEQALGGGPSGFLNKGEVNDRKGEL